MKRIFGFRKRRTSEKNFRALVNTKEKEVIFIPYDKRCLFCHQKANFQCDSYALCKSCLDKMVIEKLSEGKMDRNL